MKIYGAISDRIAGRDIDRDAIADRLDVALEHLALITDPESKDIEVCLPELESLEATIGGFRHPYGALANRKDVFRLSLPLNGTAEAAFFYSPSDEPAVSIDQTSGLLFVKVSGVSHGNVARSFGLPKAKIPGKPFMLRYWVQGAPTSTPPPPPACFSLHRGEILALRTSGNGRIVRSSAGPLKWCLAAGWDDDHDRIVVDEDIFPSKVGSFSLWGTLRALRSLMLRRFNWGVTLSHPGFTGAFVECSPDSARALFSDRNAFGRSRRAALRHWVKEHYRRGHTADEAHRVREHLRGVERFEWHGLDVQLHVPTAELEAAGLLARQEPLRLVR